MPRPAPLKARPRTHSRAAAERFSTAAPGLPSTGFAAEVATSPRVTLQRQAIESAFGPAIQRRPESHSQRPDNLRTGIESLSGVSVDDVNLRGSSQQGHLPREGEHVVPQTQGRVSATTEVAGLAVNDDASLESEADRTSVRALTQRRAAPPPLDTYHRTPVSRGSVAQRLAGEGIVITEGTLLYATRSRAANTTKLEAGAACHEMGGRTHKWVKVKVLADGRTGWVDASKTLSQPKPASVGGDEDENVAPTYTVVNRAPFISDPSRKDVSQGGLGDCWLLSPLAAIADTPAGKAAIRGMIRPNAVAGSWTVRFFIPNAEGSDETTSTAFTVDNYFPGAADRLAYSRLVDDRGSWPIIVEKAVAEARGGFDRISGGFISDAFILLTGHRPKGIGITPDPDRVDNVSAVQGKDLLSMLQDAQATKKPVAVHVPPKRATRTFDFSEGPGGYSVVLPAVGVLRLSLQLDYNTAAGKVTKKGSDKGVEIIEGARATVVGLASAHTAKPTSSAVVDYSSTTLEHAGKEFSGGHVYFFHSINAKTKQVTIVNPHDTSTLITMSMGDIAVKLNARFFIGRKELKAHPADGD